MSFRRRSSCKSSSSRGCNKVRLTSKHDIAQIESWVNFVSKNKSDNKEQFSLPSSRRKEESKQSVYDAWERMKKRHAKSLHKQTFEEQLLTEFRQFSNGAKSKLDKQNQILAQLISILKSSLTSFSAVQNINVKQKRFEMNYDNDQCGIVEHQIGKPELFHDPYPYERFETFKLPNLEKRIIKVL